MLRLRVKPMAGGAALARIVLVLVIAWAISAVAMLIGTLSAVNSIDGHVRSIRANTGEIDRELDSVHLAAKTARISRRILGAANPLSGELQQTVGAAHSIDATAQSILSRADSIRAEANSVEASTSGINGDVASIAALVGAIEGHALSINGHVHSIDASVGGIRTSFSDVLGTAERIEQGVAGINQHASITISLVRSIATVLAGTLGQVGPGPGSRHDATLEGHANSIDCSPPVRPRSTHCGK